MPAAPDRIDRVAREVFGYPSLRPGQREAIEAVLAGRDTLAVMSTGSGKSAIYQIAGLLLPGATVVVSPLIALQRDQVEELRRHAVGGAAELNSTMPRRERAEALEELEEDALEFVLLAPEQLARRDVLDELAQVRPSLFVVDEAHSISEWGHDFRPEYLRLGAVAEAIGRPTIVALTATAAPPVRDEIVARLGLRDPAIVIRGFDRPNIELTVHRFHEEAHKWRAVRAYVAEHPGPGIVYVATRRGAEALAAELVERGLRAAAYHGGLPGHERDRVQDAFMADALDAVVATTAFGMGVDKANVRWVAHGEIAESLDAYYQELGRGGRDGGPAEAVLFYRPEDLGLRRFFAGGHLEEDEIDRVLGAVDAAEGPVEPSTLQAATALGHSRLASALARLEEVGALRTQPDGSVTPLPGAPDHDAAVHAAGEREHAREAFDRSRVDMMRAYAETSVCRRAFILSYFGEPYEPPCGRCDNCRSGRSTTVAAPADVPFAVGARVVHARWGAGVVQRYDDEMVVVLFDGEGYKTLALEVVRARGDLLRLA